MGVLVGRVGIDRRLVLLAVKSHLTRVGGGIRGDVSCPVRHGLDVVKRLMDGG